MYSSIYQFRAQEVTLLLHRQGGYILNGGRTIRPGTIRPKNEKKREKTSPNLRGSIWANSPVTIFELVSLNFSILHNSYMGGRGEPFDGILQDSSLEHNCISMTISRENRQNNQNLFSKFSDEKKIVNIIYIIIQLTK